MKPYLVLLLLFTIISCQPQMTSEEPLTSNEWANFAKYESPNRALRNLPLDSNRVVFMGNSITEGWSQDSLYFFKNPSFINRGISGQTTPQMLLRFRADVIDLSPKVVVILAGINDIAENTGPISLDAIFANIKSMSDLAFANDIRVILCSTLPAYDFPWRPGMAPSEKVIKLNKRIKIFAEKAGHAYIDYWSAMADERNGMKPEYSYDEVHATVAGYQMMESVALPVIELALGD